MFLRSSEREATRCVLHGPEVERMLANGIVQKGMMVTAHGEFSARCQKRNDDGTWMAEVLCNPTRVVAETGREGRLRGAIYANLKAVAMHWDADTLQLKTYFNPEPGGRTERLTCSIHMKAWLAGMSDAGKERFKETMRVGREFTVSALVETSCYRTRTGEQVASLLLLPTDFRLQG
ncbi:hypothetical protein WJ96_04905 [Burkholderia ubonensis]|uniref:Uncharacterized protein n=2 Tax=Burkholderia ubonensis TaxID=101571 RepID=A0AAW3MX70_9BURK|nr:hypothetical protein WJ97_11825 [Burkholderia ubonensis]KVP97913.1 hypothetical protein WJ96_04905 [Burkholderia ubonensis]KVZ92610.1 hypothetical protein WL25_16560 [Burkholderia ubonensis]